MDQGLSEAVLHLDGGALRHAGQRPLDAATVPAPVVVGVARYLAAMAAATQRLSAQAIVDLAARLRAMHARGGTIFLCGNGGSAALASHLANDLGRPARQRGAGLRAVCLSDSVAVLTAWTNDEGYEAVFAGPLQRLARPGDALVAISVSGRSPNVVAAARVARGLGVEVIALTGADGGVLGGLADLAICVPSAEHGVVEAVHGALLHALSYALVALSAVSAGVVER